MDFSGKDEDISETWWAWLRSRRIRPSRLIFLIPLFLILGPLRVMDFLYFSAKTVGGPPRGNAVKISNFDFSRPVETTKIWDRDFESSLLLESFEGFRGPFP